MAASDSKRPGNERPGIVSRGSWIAFAVLLLVPLLFYGSMVFQGLEPPAPDTSAARPYVTWGAQTQESTHSVPDWYPYIFSGMPSYGSYTYTPRSPLNPLAWVQRLAGENRGLWYVVLFVIAGWGGFAFLRRQGFSALASTLGALGYSMTPYFLGCVAAGHSTKLEALCLLPLFLLALDLFLDAPGPARAAFLAASAAFLAWANHPQIVFYAGLVGVVYGAGRLLLERRARSEGSFWIRTTIFLAVAGALAAALSAEPYWAVREYAPWSIRGGAAVGGAEGAAGGLSWEYATAWSFHPRELIAFLVPGWFGLEGAAYWGPMPATQSTHYFGVIFLLLALFGLWKWRSPRRWIWAGISLGVLLIGFGRFLPVLYGPMYHFVPLFDKFRVPSMIYGLLPLTLACPAAAGLDALLHLVGASRPARADGGAPAKKGRTAQAPGARRSRSLARTFLVVAFAAVALWIALGLGAQLVSGGGSAFLRPEESARFGSEQLGILRSTRLGILQRSLAQSMAAVVLAALALAWAARRIGRSIVAGAAVALLAAADLLLVDRQFYEVAPPPPLQSSVPLRGACEYLSRQPGIFRVFPAGRELFSSNAFGLFHLESIGGYHPAKLRAYQDLLGADLVTRPAVLSMLNVRYLLSAGRIGWEVPPAYEGDGWVYPWPDSLPRAWSVEEIAVVSGFDELSARLGGDRFDPARTALVYAADAPGSTRSFAPARVEIEGRAPGSLALRVRSEGEAFIVVSEPAFPPGWRARVDGVERRPRRVNHVLQGLEVSAGEHEIELAMRSPARGVGARVSRLAGGVTLLLALGSASAAWRRRARGVDGEAPQDSASNEGRSRP